MYGLTKNGTFANRMGDLLNNNFLDSSFFNMERKQFYMPVKLTENKEQYELKTTLPGITKENINISYENDILTIQAQETKENKKEEEKIILNEQTEISCSRSFVIPDLDIEKSEAILQDGILKLILPKNENTKPKKILIK